MGKKNKDREGKDKKSFAKDLIIYVGNSTVSRDKPFELVSDVGKVIGYKANLQNSTDRIEKKDFFQRNKNYEVPRKMSSKECVRLLRTKILNAIKDYHKT